MPSKRFAGDSSELKRATTVFEKHGGIVRMSDALKAGISRRVLYALRDNGIIEQLSRGFYRLTDMPPLANPDLVTVALKVPNGVICLLSALAFHELTTQIPHEVYIAVSRQSEPPLLGYPPIRPFRVTGRAFSEGIETHRLDDVPVRIYSREKTLADCFKHRNKIGLDTTLEALKLYRQRGPVNVESLMHYAEICRVARVMRPYLELAL